jgi:uncharacterized repeat protein (TIGR01451 family)
MRIRTVAACDRITTILSVTFALLWSSPLYASTITVTSGSGGTGGPACTLRDAVTAANNDAAVGGCSAGSGTDTILLTSDVSLTTADNGINGLPIVTTKMAINGQGHTISGNSTTFRILQIAATGDLTLENVILEGGKVVGAAGANGGNGTNGVPGTGPVGINNQACSGVNGGPPFGFGLDGIPGTSGINGANAVGGAILNAGKLTIFTSILRNNALVGGKAGNGGNGGSGGKGADGANAPTSSDGSPGSSGADGCNGGVGADARSGGSGGGAYGGAIYNTGTLTVSRSAVISNSVTGGAGGTGGTGGAAGAGGKGGNGANGINTSGIFCPASGGTGGAGGLSGVNNGSGGAGGGGGDAIGAAIFNDGGIVDLGGTTPTGILGGSTVSGNVATGGVGGIGGPGASGPGGAGGNGGNGSGTGASGCGAGQQATGKGGNGGNGGAARGNVVANVTTNIVSPGGGGGTGGDALGALAHSPGANATSTFSVVNVTLSDNTSTPGAGGAAAHGGNAASGGAGGIGGQGGAEGAPNGSTGAARATPVGGTGGRGGNGGNGTGGATMPGSSSSQNLIAFLQSTVAFNSAAVGSPGAAGAGGTGSATGTPGAAGTGGSVLGGGLGGSATLSGTMITNNAGGTQCQFAPATPIVSSGHNLASDASCNLTQASDLASNTLAGLGWLADNGGVALPGGNALFTRSIGTTSSAYTTGACAAAAVDERGIPRKAQCDIGAFEFGAPQLAKQFDPSAIFVGGTSTLRITVSTVASQLPFSSFGFTDTLSTNLTTAGVAQTSCVSGTPSTSSTSVSLAGVSLPAGPTSCTLTVPVTSTIVATYPNGQANVTGFTSDQTGPVGAPSFSSQLVVAALPALATSFTPAVVLLGTPFTLTLTISTGVGAPAVSGIAFSDTLPSGVTIVANSPQTTCAGGTAGGTSTTLTLGGGTLPAGGGSCTVTASVIASAVGSFTTSAANISGFTSIGTGAIALAPGSVSSTLQVQQGSFVTTQSVPQSVCESATASFTAAAGGTPTPTVQWQVSTDGGSSFNDIPGAVSTTLSFTAAVSQNGNRYRAVFTNVWGTATSNPALLTVTTKADLAVSMTATPGPVAPGGTTTYTATITNTGPASAANVVLAQTLPVGATFESAIPSQGTCGATANVTCQLGTLAAGASATVTVTVTITASNEGTATSTATVSSGACDGNAANDSSSASTLVNPPAIPVLDAHVLVLLALLMAAIAVMRRAEAR